MIVDICYRGIDFLSGDLVEDSDEDRTDGGDAAGDEDNPEVGATLISYVRKKWISAYLAQMSK